MASHSIEPALEIPPPVLRFVPTDSVLAHEEHDQQRFAPLLKRIPQSGIWLHPPIVAPIPDSNGKYVILDGANRCHAVAELGYPHILVQTVEYDSGQVTLDTWSHVISHLATNAFLPDILALNEVGIHKADIWTARAELANREALAYIIDVVNSREVYVIDSNARGMRARTELLRSIVDTYISRCVLERINTADPVHVEQMFTNATALVVFPHYESAEIVVAAREQILLPPGISRHIIQGRAMRLLYPLEVLIDSNTPLDQKNADLQAWVNNRIAKRAVRLYAEATYNFDD
jgi:hypothetical protein